MSRRKGKRWWLWRPRGGGLLGSAEEPTWNGHLDNWDVFGSPWACTIVLRWMLGDLPESGELWEMRGCDVVQIWVWE